MVLFCLFVWVGFCPNYSFGFASSAWMASPLTPACACSSVLIADVKMNNFYYQGLTFGDLPPKSLSLEQESGQNPPITHVTVPGLYTLAVYLPYQALGSVT